MGIIHTVLLYNPWFTDQNNNRKMSVRGARLRCGAQSVTSFLTPLIPMKSNPNVSIYAKMNLQTALFCFFFENLLATVIVLMLHFIHSS